jgi:ketosteroid isomerase-like protein
MNRRLYLVTIFAALVMTAACSEPPPPPPPAAPPPPTAEARVKMYQDCWNQFNTRAWDQFQNCYTEDATSETVDSMTPLARGRAAIIDKDKQLLAPFTDARGELRLILINGTHIASIGIWHGTNDGPMTGPDGKTIPPSKKKIGLWIAHTVDGEATGVRATSDAGYLEEGTVMAQIGLSKAPARPAMAPTGAPVTVVIAKNDDVEQRNIAVVRAGFDGMNRHDYAAIQATLADNFKFIEVGHATDQNAKQMLAGLKEFVGGFSDLKANLTRTWGAGDWVVTSGNLDGTNDGPMPSMGLTKKTGKKFSGKFIEIFKVENGKVAEDWLFYNTAALATQLGLK